MIETLHLQLLLATFAGWVTRQQSQAVAYLVEENRVLKEQHTSSEKRLRFTDDQRRRLTAKGKPLGRKVLCQIAAIVTPDTILAARGSLESASDWAGYSSTITGGRREMGSLDLIFGYDGVTSVAPTTESTINVNSNSFSVSLDTRISKQPSVYPDNLTGDICGVVARKKLNEFRNLVGAP